MRYPVVGTQSQSFYVVVQTLGEKLVEIGATAPDFAIDSVAVRLRPAVGSWHLALQMHLPASEEKVEVVLTVPGQRAVRSIMLGRGDSLGPTQTGLRRQECHRGDRAKLNLSECSHCPCALNVLRSASAGRDDGNER